MRNITPCTSTTITFDLSRQIIDQLPNGVLLDCSDLNISINPRQFPLLQSPAKEALRRAIANRGQRMIVNSGYRSCVQQFLLRTWFEQGRCGIPAAALPGRSNHESGLALDIQDPRGWDRFMIPQGWRPLPGDPPHFDYVGRGTRILGSEGVLAFQRLWNRFNSSDQIDEDGVYGPQTGSRMRMSPSEGFGIVAPGQLPILRLTTPLTNNGDVRRVQQRLFELGFLSGANSVDSFFGPTTEAAVREFQRERGLSVDGIVGQQTYEALGLDPRGTTEESGSTTVTILEDPTTPEVILDGERRGRVNSNTTSTLQLRSAANTGSRILASLSPGTDLLVKAGLSGGDYDANGSTRNDWYRAEASGQDGFVAAFFVDLLPLTGRVNSMVQTQLRVRDAASTSGAVISDLSSI